MNKLLKIVTLGFFSLAISIGAIAVHHGMKKDIVNTAVAGNLMAADVVKLNSVKTVQGQSINLVI